MKKLTLFFICICLTLCLSACNSKKDEGDTLGKIKLTKQITIGVKSDSKPFGFMDEKNELQGFDVDVAKTVTKYLLNEHPDTKINFVYVTPQTRIADLNSKKVDILIATMSINQRRSKVVDFSDPYFIAGQALMVKKGSEINSMQDLNNKKAAIILGTTGEKTLRQLAPSAIIRGAKSYTDALSLLKNNEVQAILADDSILYGLASGNNNYIILPKRYTREYYAIALRKGSENEELKFSINKILEAMQHKGVLNRIKEKWIPQNQIRMEKND